MTTRAERLPKGKRGQWTSERMLSAIDAMKSGTGLNAAAKAYGVPKATLKRHLLGSNKTARDGFKQLGRSTDLPMELEEQLAQHILHMEAMFYGFSTQSVRKLAYQIAVINQIPHRFNKEKQTAGKEWLSGFLKRHPEISVRSPQATSLARASGFNRVRVNAFFDLLEELVHKYGLTADRIYNTDEKGLTAVQKPGKVLARKGKSQVGSITSAEKGQNVTFVCCMSACGHFIPPMVVFPRKRMNPQLQDGAPPGTAFTCQENGWMTVDLFSDWMSHFIQYAKPDKEKPLLLVLDGHVSHTHNLKALEMAREAGVIMLSLPSHTTHRMQPLDVAFFRPLSTYYAQEADMWMRKNPGRPLSHFQVCQLFGKAYARAASMETAINGFCRAGIWPVDRSVFQDSDFAPSDVTFVPISEVNSSMPSMTSQETSGSMPSNNGFHEQSTTGLHSEASEQPMCQTLTLERSASCSFIDGTGFVNDTGNTVTVEYISNAVEPGSVQREDEVSHVTIEADCTCIELLHSSNAVKDT